MATARAFLATLGAIQVTLACNLLEFTVGHVSWPIHPGVGGRTWQLRGISPLLHGE